MDALVVALVPFTAIGLLAGLCIFSTTDVGLLKRFYGVFVLCFSVLETARMLMARAGVLDLELFTLRSILLLP